MPEDDKRYDARPIDDSEWEGSPGDANSLPVHLYRDETEPEIIARLELLDDVIFAAIEGDAVAMERAADAWRAALTDLGPDIVDESRREYLRRARTVWESLRREPNHPPHKLFAAIEIISLLAGQQGFRQ